MILEVLLGFFKLYGSVLDIFAAENMRHLGKLTCFIRNENLSFLIHDNISPKQSLFSQVCNTIPTLL